MDTSLFDEAMNGDFDKLSAFMGDSTSGGFLKAATDALNSLEDSTTGAIKVSMTSVQDEITTAGDRIDEEQDRIDKLQTSLQERMAAADALIASMEQQVSYITSMFESMRTASQSMQ